MGINKPSCFQNIPQSWKWISNRNLWYYIIWGFTFDFSTLIFQGHWNCIAQKPCCWFSSHGARLGWKQQFVCWKGHVCCFGLILKPQHLVCSPTPSPKTWKTVMLKIQISNKSHQPCNCPSASKDKLKKSINEVHVSKRIDNISGSYALH